jgi:beta-lactamase regulating signal transducer with metallopeptidase domain
MTDPGLMLHPTDLAWLRWVVGATVSTGILLAAAFALDVVLRRRVEARWRVLLPAVVLLRLALPLQWTSPLGVLGVRAAVTRSAVVEAPVVVEPVAVAAGVPLATSAPRAGLPSLAPMLHMSVALALLGIALASRRRASSALRGARPARASVAKLAAGVPVVEHDVLGPAVVGLLRPRIVMPTPLVDALAEEEVASVLRHEVAHVRRRDPVVRALVQVATFAAWPVLPAWLAAWWLRGLVEQACDERALEGGGAQARGIHARALVDVATWRPRPLRLALGLLPFGEGVRARVKALRFSRRWAMPAQVACVASLASLIMLTLGARAAAPAAAPEPSPAEAAHVPPLMRLRVEMFRAKDVGEVEGVGLDDVDAGVRVGELLDAGQAEALRARLKAAGMAMDDHAISSEVGSHAAVQFKLNAAVEEPGAVLGVMFGPVREGSSISLTLKINQKPVRRSEVAFRLSDSVLTAHFVAFEANPSGAIHLLVTPLNVRYPAGSAAVVDSPRVSLDVTEQPLADVAKLVGDAGGLLLPVDDAIATKAVTITLADVAWEEAVERLAEAAGVEWSMEKGMLRLVDPAAATAEVAGHRAGSSDAAVLTRLREILAAGNVVDSAVEPGADGIILSGGIKDSMSLAALSNTIGETFDHAFLEVLIDDKASGATHFRINVKWPRQVIAEVFVVRVPLRADADAIRAGMKAGTPPGADRVILRVPLDSALADFVRLARQMEAGDRASVLVHSKATSLMGSPVQVTSGSVGQEPLLIEVIPRGRREALAADVELTLPWTPVGPIAVHLPASATVLEIAEPEGGVTFVGLQLHESED